MKLKILLPVMIIGFFSGNAFAQNDVSKINGLLEDFSIELSNVLPNASVQTNTYSDAWIGKFFPSVPMHFAVGIDGGITSVDISSIKKAGEMVNILSIPDSFLFPTVNFNAKIGGLFLPFDVGASFAVLDTTKLGKSLDKIDLEYLSAGGNLRYAILQGTGPLPKLSIGAGFYYTKGSIGKSNSGFGINTEYEVKTFVAETQLSKTIVFFTPFIGFRGIWSEVDADSSWKSSAGLSNGSATVNSGGVSYKTKPGDNFIPQVFGGFGFKLGVVQLDVNATYDLTNQIWGTGASLRFQL
ncbi:MAG: hypothetical protein IK002_09885 [Treponema sp.]|uniref:hypothetical protein n=1 Tax=Treponema sp. TaxID=166 RepID=UPI00298E67F9|nr:hypothetical protein [Treponema sp.]MBR5934285.1 hypothetical protein [Treponema sp.]